MINLTRLNLSKILEITDLGDASYILGMEITRNRKTRTIKLSQNKNIINLREKYNKC